jgi:SWI/SNF related-matrix-associated actin-dependent regulator of chromatin subfamily C
LTEKGSHVEPKFFLRKELSKEDKDKIREIAKKRNATVVEAESEASHIIFPSADPDNDAYCKAVFRRGDKCLVHFYRMPESHDNWGLVTNTFF